jgi:hypothetical protein
MTATDRSAPLGTRVTGTPIARCLGQDWQACLSSLAVPPYPASSTELERQRARIDVLFRNGWILKGPDRPPETTRQSLPFIKGVGDDAEVIITGHGVRQCVAALFSHQGFPGVRFGHRFTPGDEHAPIWLKEEIETGALHRMMQAQPAPDDAGIVWTTWGPTGASDPQ